MNINPFKRIARLEAEVKETRAAHTKLLHDLTDYWNRVAKVEKQAAAATSMASATMDVMAKLPGIAVMEEAVALAKQFDERLDRVRDRIDKNLSDQWAAINELDKEMDARKIGAEHLDKRISTLGESVVLLSALRYIVTPEEASRKAVNNQLAQDQAKLEQERAKQREYNAAYRARQKAKRAEEAKRIKAREYKRAWTARKKAEKDAQTTPGAAQ
jgi:hypothetical protein